MCEFFKELYLTAFTIFFRLGVSWTPAHDAGKGAAGVTLIEFLVLLAIEGWVEVLAGKRFLAHFPKWGVVIAFLAVGAANHYLLVIRGHGTAFERQFSGLKSSKKTVLVGSCVATMLAAVAFFIYSAVVHRRFIGIHD